MVVTVTLTLRQAEWLETRTSDEANAELARGEVITLEEHEARNKVRFSALNT